MDDTKKLRDALEWAIQEMELKQDGVGKILNLKQPAVSLLLGGRRKVNQGHIKKMASKMGITPEDLMKKSALWYSVATGDDSDQPITNNNISTIEHEHVKVVKQFQQKELALEINHLLLDIERNNPSLLSVIKQQLSGLAATCYPAPQKKRNTGTGTE